MQPATLECSCGNRFNVVYYASINTSNMAFLVEELLEGKLYDFQCKKCNNLIHLSTKVLISGPGRMVAVSTDDKPEIIKKQLEKNGFIDNNGDIIDPMAERFLDVLRKKGLLDKKPVEKSKNNDVI